jgi:hypothetical protein
MGLWDKVVEKAAALDERQAERDAARLAARTKREFDATPWGQASAARANGARLFQITLPLSTSKATVVPMAGAFTDIEAGNHGKTLDLIEREGWKLDHVGYVFRALGSESRDKFLASGQQEAISGEIVGIYIFRVVEGARGNVMTSVEQDAQEVTEVGSDAARTMSTETIQSDLHGWP